MNLSLPQSVRMDATPVSTITVVLGAALDAYRDGTLEDLLRHRPGAARWLERKYLNVISGAAGDALPGARALTASVELLLTWAATQLRPDRAPSLVIAEREYWLERTSWRPAIAVMCHYGFAPVPEFRDRYYRSAGESAVDNLCGLWNIGSSTFYRYLDKGKRLMARLLHEQRLDQRHSIALRQFAQLHAYRTLGLDSDEQRAQWHTEHAARAAQRGDFASAAWHLAESGEIAAWRALLIRHAALFAGQPETDAHLRRLVSTGALQRGALDLELVEAALARARSQPDAEREAYERALRHAADAKASIDLGIIYSHLGKYYEARDADRAMACYRESVDMLGPALEQPGADADAHVAGDAAIVEAYVETMVKLAWLYTLRNDPRARAVLDAAQTTCARWPVEETTVVLLEQVWGEFLRRSEHYADALAHGMRALSIYERRGDQEGVIKANLNIGLVYIDQNQLDRAVETYCHALQLMQSTPASPELVASAHLNLGIAHYLGKQFDAAIEQYSFVLALSESQNLKLGSARAHHGLAECHYGRFLISRDPADEAAGDAHVQAAAAAYTEANNAGYAELVRQVKLDILGGATKERTDDRLLPQETAANISEATEIERQRAILATPGKPEDHVRAHLTIARAYLAISAKEREAALQLISRHGLHDLFAEEFQQLRATYERELTREQQLAAAWKAAAGELLSDERRAAVLARLIERGSINKSAYAELCGVGLATASKHLAQLTELGLLLQVGKGPSTRYVLA